jgi:hypothetical protein
MKRILLLFVCCFLLGSVAYARRIAWEATHSPPVWRGSTAPLTNANDSAGAQLVADIESLDALFGLLDSSDPDSLSQRCDSYLFRCKGVPPWLVL